MAGLLRRKSQLEVCFFVFDVAYFQSWCQDKNPFKRADSTRKLSQFPLDIDHDEERDPLSSELIGQAEDHRDLPDTAAINRDDYLDDCKHL